MAWVRANALAEENKGLKTHLAKLSELTEKLRDLDKQLLQKQEKQLNLAKKENKELRLSLEDLEKKTQDTTLEVQGLKVGSLDPNNYFKGRDT